MKNITISKTEFNTVTEFIFSFEQSENHLPSPIQKTATLSVKHSINASEKDIIKNMVRTAINVLTKEEQMNLVKISSCSFYFDEYPKEIQNKLTTALTWFIGSWYFHIDQRSVIENELIKENPVIARNIYRFTG
ncbi:MAG: hypothetical protein MK084_06090 [Prochlorococcus sp. ALOHA_A2.0_50]|nr:hypothetical protein [Prochlorococcus sp. ALOHA_A2.0_50]